MVGVFSGTVFAENMGARDFTLAGYLKPLGTSVRSDSSDHVSSRLVGGVGSGFCWDVSDLAVVSWTIG